MAHVSAPRDSQEGRQDSLVPGPQRSCRRTTRHSADVAQLGELDERMNEVVLRYGRWRAG